MSFGNKCKPLVQLLEKIYVDCDATMTETHVHA